MKLVTYTAPQTRSQPRAGAWMDDGRAIIDLLAVSERGRGANPAFASVQSMIEGGAESLDLAYDLVANAPDSVRIDRADARLLAPVSPPAQIRDCLCFEGHLRQAYANARRVRAQQFEDPEAKLAELEASGYLAIPDIFYEQPIYYKANRFAVIGTDQDVIWPSYSNILDFELEFGAYIGRRAKDVSKDDARPYIYGYTIFNDITARDAQTAEMGGQLGPAKGKDFDTANVMGPCLVTADELTDPYDLTMIARVNGEEWTRGNTRSMHWTFEDLIAHISRSETLYPGEFLGSGTIEGGCGLEHMRFLSPGDVVELEVEGIGILRSHITRPDRIGAPR